jgi:hypothetical protein
MHRRMRGNTIKAGEALAARTTIVKPQRRLSRAGA